MPANKKLLLIDDDLDLLRGVQARLRAAGYEIRTVDNGERGLAVAGEFQPDTIVLDVRMPGMDGLCVLSELQRRHETAHIPVVMLSACVQVQREALDLGARFFLVKPYDGKALVGAIEAAVRHQRH